MPLTLLMTKEACAQKIKLIDSNLVANKVYITTEKLHSKAVVKVIKDSTLREVDEPTFVRVKNIDFKNGVIEVNVFSRLLESLLIVVMVLNIFSMEARMKVLSASILEAWRGAME